MTDEVKFKIGKWVFIPGRNQLSDGKTKLRVEDRAGRALEYLCRNAGSVVSKETLIEEVWAGRHLSEQSVPVVISYLRKTFNDAGDKSEIIQTIPKKGYRLIGAKLLAGGDEESARKKWFGVAAALALFAIFAVYFFQGQETEARKPGIILTLNDLQNGTGDETLMPKVIALSEAGSYYLSKASGILLIRHWWNVGAADPTGGIYERYGAEAPVYHISGTLIQEGNHLNVTLFLNDPKTDEVLWSEAYEMTEDQFIEAHLQNLGKILAFLGLKENIPPPGVESSSPEAVTDYWIGLYLWHLGGKDAAIAAASQWQKALEKDPDLTPARVGLRALQAKWPDITSVFIGFPEIPADTENSAILVQEATIALNLEGDLEKAGELARRALAISPNDHAAYALLAEVLVREGKIEEGLKAIREAHLLAPYSTVYSEREGELKESLEGGD